MSEPFDHAASNGRRGRHAAPTESRRPDYPDYPDHLADADHPAAADHPIDRPHGHNGPADGQSRLSTNGAGVSTPYPGYGLPAEWVRPPNGLSPASTQPSLTNPGWDESAGPEPTGQAGPNPSAIAEPEWQSQAAHPDWRAQAPEPGWPTPAPAPEPPRPAASAELVVAEYGWPGPGPTSSAADPGGQGPHPEAYHRPDPAGTGPATPTWERHAGPEPTRWGSFTEPAQPRGGPPAPEPAVPGQVSRHGTDRTDTGRTDTGRTDTGRTDTSRTGPDRTGPSRAESNRTEPGRTGHSHPFRPDVDRLAGDEQRHRLGRLTEAVVDLADGCRALAADLYSVASSRHGTAGTDTARTAAEVARLLDRAAEGTDGVRKLLEAARRSLAERPANTNPAGADTAERAAVRRSFDHLVVPESAGRNGSTPHDPRVPSTTPQQREATMPPEFPSTAPSYPPVLPLGLRDGAQAAAVARQVEAARRHLLAALTVGHDVNDPAWRQQLLGTVEQVLSAVAEVAALARDALAPAATDTTFPGEARFLCALPWEQVPVASPERSDLPASVNGVATLLAALGYEARATRTEQNALQVEVRGARYAARVVLQQLRLSGTGEWMAYLDWTDGGGHPRSGAETLGPAELSDDELARRVDDSLRRRVGPQSG